MIEAAEHFYDDDPASGPADVRTRLAGVSYFFLGNGLMQAVVQFAPGGEGTPLGLLIMDAERLGKKREALTMHPREGLAPTMVRIVVDGEVHAPRADAVSVNWTIDAGVPAVRARWTSGDVEVEETFYCPTRTEPLLARAVSVWLRSGRAADLEVITGPSDLAVGMSSSVEAGERLYLTLKYKACPPEEETAGELARVEVQFSGAVPVTMEAACYWAQSACARFGDDLLDRLVAGSATQLPAAVSARGRVDGSIWQYNREWVRDQAFVALALTVSGHAATAATMLERLLREFVTAEGATLDSSEVRSRDEAELDQNGVLLYVLNEYVRWTGDSDLIARWWPRIEALAEYPLGAGFRHPASGMPANAREYWERHRLHGIEPGFELPQQVFVSIGLASAAALARLTGHEEHAARWDAEAARLEHHVLEDPTYALVDERGFIKRRGLDGRVQESISPMAEAHLPPGVPLLRPGPHPLNPDTCTVLPIVFGFVPADSDIARRTLASVEALWNQEWTGGGYGRYHAASEADSPGAWPFASVFVARAAVEAGDGERAWRVLRWLDTVPGAAACSWFEFYGERISPPFPQVGIIPWMWAELLLFFVYHVLGVRPAPDGVRIRPHLLPGLTHVRASLPMRGHWLHLDLDRGSRTEVLLHDQPGEGLHSQRGEGVVAQGFSPVMTSEQFVPYDAFSQDVTIKMQLPEAGA